MRNATPKQSPEAFLFNKLMEHQNGRPSRSSLFHPKDFKIHEVRPRAPAVLQGVAALAAAPPPPPLGPLAAFEGTWIGIGFNTIFRPQKQTFPLPHPAPGDNLLELNLTSETLSFS